MVWKGRLRFVAIAAAMCVVGWAVTRFADGVGVAILVIGACALAVNLIVLAAEVIQERRSADPAQLVAAMNRLVGDALDDESLVRDAVRTGILRRPTMDPVAMFGGLPESIGRRPAWLTEVMATSETDLLLGRTTCDLVVCSGSLWAVNHLVATIPLHHVVAVEYETRTMPWGRQSLLGLRFADGTTVALAVRPPSRVAVGRFVGSAFGS